MIRDFKDLIIAFGGPTAYSQLLGININTAKAQSARNSIPSWYFPKIVKAAKLHGIEGITYELLIKLHMKSKSLSLA